MLSANPAGRQPKPKEIMSHTPNAARAKADAEFEKERSEARFREKTRETRDPETLARDGNTARLRALRLARDGVERNS
jgi:hypothetical protein